MYTEIIYLIHLILGCKMLNKIEVCKDPSPSTFALSMSKPLGVKMHS